MVVAKKAVKKKVVKKKAIKKPAAKKKVAAKKKATPKKAVAKNSVAKKSIKKKAAPTKVTPIRSAKAKNIIVPEFKGFIPYREKKGEHYMNEKHIKHFRGLLNVWKLQLMVEVDRTVHHMQDDAANFPDPNDRATQESEFALELRTRDRERKLIKKIDEATTNLDNNDFGYCETCGVEIGIKRLEARPTATLCIECKTLDEIREKQMRG